MRKFTFLLSFLFVIGFAVQATTYTIDFENEQKSSYTSGEVKLGGTDSIRWNLTDVLIAKTSLNNADYIVGSGSLRLRGYTTSAATMLENKIGGIGTISFTYKRYGTDSQIPFKVEWSSDGTTWITIGDAITATETEQTYTYTLNQANARIRIVANGTSTSNKRMNIDNIVITDNGGAPVSSMPVITPGTGSIYGATNVTITSPTTGAVIYYTLDNSTPDNTKTLYTNPFTVTSSTTVKAIAYETGKDPSPIATATYTLQSYTDISNIAGLRAITVPSTEVYRLSGEAVLTLKSATRNAKYIQDATGAIVIDDLNGVIKTNYNLGDGITGIVGTLAKFSEMLQFTPVADPGVATSTGNTVIPKEVTLDVIGDYQAQLVKIKNVMISDQTSGGNGTFVAAKNFPITVGSLSGVLRTAYSDLDYIGSTIPTSPKDITGVVMTFNTTQQLVPRSLAEMTTTGLFSNKFDALTLWTSAGKINFRATAGEVVEVYNTMGQKVFNTLAAEGQNEVAVSLRGVAIVKVGNRVGKVIL